MKQLRFLGLALVVFGLVACASKLTNENLAKVKTGMSESEVKAILGSPTQVETGEALGIRGTTYYYKSGDTQVKIVFVNDGVVTKEGSFK